MAKWREPMSDNFKAEQEQFAATINDAVKAIKASLEDVSKAAADNSGFSGEKGGRRCRQPVHGSVWGRPGLCRARRSQSGQIRF